MDFDLHLDLEASVQKSCAESDDYNEGVRAFLTAKIRPSGYANFMPQRVFAIVTSFFQASLSFDYAALGVVNRHLKAPVVVPTSWHKGRLV